MESLEIVAASYCRNPTIWLACSQPEAASLVSVCTCTHYEGHPNAVREIARPSLQRMSQ